jgi:hypothetical protein
VSIAFDIQLYLEDVQLKRQIDHQIRIAETSQNKDEQIMEKMKQNVAYIEEKLQEVEHQIRDGTYRRTTAMAFVTFSSQLCDQCLLSGRNETVLENSWNEQRNVCHSLPQGTTLLLNLSIVSLQLGSREHSFSGTN